MSGRHTRCGAPQRGPRRRMRTDRGAAAVEFGLLAVLLFTLLFGIIQFGLWLWSWQSGGHAAREAARVAAVSPCDVAGIEDRGRDRLDGAPVKNVQVDVTQPSDMAVGEDIKVEISFEVIDLKFFPWFSSDVTKAVVARVENVPATGCTP